MTKTAKSAQANPPDPKKKRQTASLTHKLARLGLARQLDLILHLPLRYEDESRIVAIASLSGGETQDEAHQSVQVKGTILTCEVLPRPRRQLVARLEDESGILTLRFLHFYPSQQKMLAPGAEIRAFGEVRQGYFGLEMVHPRLSPASAPLPQTLTPVYPTTAGLTQAALGKLILRALEQISLPETLPEGWQQGMDALPALPTLMEAVTLLHHPPPKADQEALICRAHPAWLRVKLDELLAQQISLRLAYQRRRASSAAPLPGDGTWSNALIASLPFPLTAAQRRVAAEISADLTTTHPMQRLLQGDVGAGKTLVAALAACQAIESGFQVAFMAPTEILAEQHFLKFSDWLAPLGARIAWLSGGKKARDKQKERQAAWEAELIIGTHALIQEGVDFSRLGLVIIDEQHRFGVRQRLALHQKGKTPHQLMMSATPIPRTLAMSYCADLDVSTLDELPPGRSPVRTRLVRMERREEIMAWARQEMAKGRQTYWVCPLIEESETLELQTALETHAWLKEAMPEHAVGLVHGRLKPAEKQEVMTAFVAGKIQLLVATTVIEVGVDVPNASLMIIEHAERFGLAQLHQLRGRVGRGSAQSVCVLLYAEPLSPMARERLKILFETTDGFEIARRDLQLRGPGEFIGSRQSGIPMLRYADLESDAYLVEIARNLASLLIERYPDQARQHAERWLGEKEKTLHA
ncbi:MAG: ATP-dependent DNA helicase RecG [Zoogloeaceae bacterium]|jgi:ATP-dependent DNA helicase RecG|nr:ATP-dependent DNA helicase RecG [Zoogloeaceae bacterium]